VPPRRDSTFSLVKLGGYAASKLRFTLHWFTPRSSLDAQLSAWSWSSTTLKQNLKPDPAQLETIRTFGGLVALVHQEFGNKMGHPSSLSAAAPPETAARKSR
ncbi:MAG TPA: hypothetical protein VGD27_06645, partial [Longimicrobiales bacterium]